MLSIEVDNVKPPLCVVDRWQLDSKIKNNFSLSPGQGNLMNKCIIAIAGSNITNSCTEPENAVLLRI